MNFNEIMAKLAAGKGDEIKSVLQTQFNEEFLKTLDDGKNLLHYCALSDKNIAAAKIILNSEEFRSKFDIDATDKIGLTPLHIAAISGSREMSMLLIEHGANKFIEVSTDRGNRNSIQFAARSGNLELANDIERKVYIPRTPAQQLNTAEKENQTPTETHYSWLNLLTAPLISLFSYNTPQAKGYSPVSNSPAPGIYQKQKRA